MHARTGVQPSSNPSFHCTIAIELRPDFGPLEVAWDPQGASQYPDSRLLGCGEPLLGSPGSCLTLSEESKLSSLNIQASH